MYRYKKIFTGDLKAKKPENEVNEVRIKCKIVKNLLKSDYPPLKEVALTPIFAMHRKFYSTHRPTGKAPHEHNHAQRTWIFKLY